MEIKIIKTKDGYVLSGNLPQEMEDAGELELFPLKSGAYLLTVKGFIEKTREKPGEPKVAALSEQEKALIRKLLSIRFDSRTPEEVEKSLGGEEKTILEGLVKKRAVHVFYGKKYKKSGVYNISDSAFSEARQPQSRNFAQATGKDSPSETRQPQSRNFAQATGKDSPPEKSHLQENRPQEPPGQEEHLRKFGWAVVASEPDAVSFASKFPKEMKDGDIKGMRAFDKRFYFVEKKFLEKWQEKVEQALSERDMTSKEISENIGLTEDACRAMLTHLCESGQILEKRKGKFSIA